ncbi:MAG: hypothetical protein M3145_04965 [Pseudomonadota bacterium]|nr:hypothetical protein [Pseudomonadota bacterium]
MTRTRAFLLATSALLTLGIGPSLAGPCAEQIAQMEKTVVGGMNMASSNAVQGSGQAPGGSAAQASATPPVSATPSQTPKAGQAPDTGATVAMNKVTENIATSPQDVRAQQQGQPMTAQTAQAASGQGSASPQGSAPQQQAGTSPGATGDQVNKDRVNQALAVLNRAKELDSQGKDTDCTNAVMEARRIYGQQ